MFMKFFSLVCVAAVNIVTVEVSCLGGINSSMLLINN